MVPVLRSKSFGIAMLLAGSLSVPNNALADTKLVFWSMWNEPEPQARALSQIMAAYTKSHPDVTFEVAWNGRQNQTKLRGALQAGIPIDFMDQDANQLAGGLQKDDLGYEVDGILDPATTEAFLPGTFDLYAKAGRHVQLPYIYNTVNFWYSKALLEETKSETPQTFDELLSLCGAVSSHGKNALVIESNVGGYNWLYFSHLIERRLGPGSLMHIMLDKSGDGWKNPAVLQAAQDERKLWDAKCIAEDARGFQYPAGQQTIAFGDSLGELVGSWLPSELASSAGKDFRWGAFNFPTVAGGSGKATDLEVALLSFMVLKNSPNPKEAIDFIKFALGEHSQKLMAEIGGVGVTRKGVKWPEALHDAEAAASQATALQGVGGGLDVAYPAFYATVAEPEHNKMFLGQIAPEVLVDILAAKTKEYWERNPG